MGRERAKLGYFWRHAYRVPHSGPYAGCVVNSDTGKPVIIDDSRLTADEFEKVKIADHRDQRRSPAPTGQPALAGGLGQDPPHGPIEFIGRYMPEWFDYAICDEVHRLAGDTAQGNAWNSSLMHRQDRGLTGTLSVAMRTTCLTLSSASKREG